MWSVALFATLALMVVKDVYDAITFDPRAPVSNLRMVPIDSPVSVGEKLHVRVYRQKVREDCAPLTSTRSAASLDTGQEYDLPSRTWRGGQVGTEFVDLEFDTSALPPGNYRGLAVASYPCPGFDFVARSEFFFKVTP